MITKNLCRFIENVQKNHILFWQLIQHYQEVILQDLGKKNFNLTKMTVTDRIKVLGDKIKSNLAQYDREAAKISALSSKFLLDKYEYLAGEDLG